MNQLRLGMCHKRRLSLTFPPFLAKHSLSSPGSKPCPTPSPFWFSPSCFSTKSTFLFKNCPLSLENPEMVKTAPGSRSQNAPCATFVVQREDPQELLLPTRPSQPWISVESGRLGRHKVFLGENQCIQCLIPTVATLLVGQYPCSRFLSFPARWSGLF